MTTAVNNNVVFNDTTSKENFYFQYLINTFFNTKINEYKQYKKITNDIIFIYKGGTSMQIIHRKYQKLFNNDFNVADLFKRSDSDYQIFIKENDETKYFNIYYDINVITHNILNKIRDFLSNYINTEILLLNKFDDNKLQSILNIANQTLIKQKVNAL